MEKRITLFILLLFIFTFGKTFGQIENDTLISNNIDTAALNQVDSNLDSLLTIWYVKTSVYQDTTIQYFSGLDHYKDIPDSVIIERLAMIPTIIELSYNEKVRAWIELYIKKGEYLIPSLLGLGEYYFPLFEEVLDANDMPLELKYLPVVESSLNPSAVSRAGATGLWQFLYSTGKLYDLEINSLVDERRDPIKSTYAAVNFLKDLYNIYGDWVLVIAAYNCGPGNVNKAIKRSKGSTNYWEIYSYLPKETRGYIPAFIAATYVMTYYKEHNFHPIEIEVPLYTDTLMISEKLHLMQVAEVLGIPIDQLRDMNPQYKKDILPGEGEAYPLKLPFEFTGKFIELSDSIYAYLDTVYFNPEYKVVEVPTYVASNSYSYSSTPCEDYDLTGKTELNYTVKSGDTYAFIANWYDVSITDMKCWNDAYSDKLDVGDVLIVYVPTKKLSYYSSINTKTFDEKQEVASTLIVANSKNTTTPLDDKFVYYTIKSGDNISAIASKFDGVTENDIIALNDFDNYDITHLQIGQVIKIKPK